MLTSLSFEIPIQVEKFLKVFKGTNFKFLPNAPDLIMKANNFVIKGQESPFLGGKFTLNKKGTFFLLNNGVFLTVFCTF